MHYTKLEYTAAHRNKKETNRLNNSHNIETDIENIDYPKAPQCKQTLNEKY